MSLEDFTTWRIDMPVAGVKWKMEISYSTAVAINRRLRSELETLRAEQMRYDMIRLERREARIRLERREARIRLERREAEEFAATMSQTLEEEFFSRR